MTDVTTHGLPCMHVCLYVYVCLSVTLVHSAKAVGQNEMPFGRDTRVVPSNIVLVRALVPHRKGRFGGENPQFAEMPLIAKLLWPVFSVF